MRMRGGLALAVMVLVAAATGCIWDLGTLPHHTFAYTADVNDAGVIVGESAFDVGSYETVRPFRWAPGQQMQELPLLPGDVWGTANAINAAGTSVGKSCADNDIMNCRAVRWDASDRATALPVSGSAHPTDINDSGVVVGDIVKPNRYPTAFAWSPGDTAETRLPLPAGVVDSTAVAVNASGVVAGTTYLTNGYGAVRWRVGQPGYDTLSGGGLPVDINASGTVVATGRGITTYGPEPGAAAVTVSGNLCYPPTDRCEAHVWRPGRAPEKLGVLAADGGSIVLAASPGGKLAGAATTSRGWRAVRYFGI